MSVFVDTSAILAVMDADDAMHTRAAGIWQELVRGDEPLYTSNYVIVETVALLQRRFGQAALRMFAESMLPVFTLVYVTPDLHQRAMSAVLAGTGKRSPSLVDCVSFEVIRDVGVNTVFAFDNHFKERGYTLKN